MIDDRDPNLRPVTVHRDFRRRRVAAILERVLDQVLDDLLHPGPVDRGDQWLVWPGGLDGGSLRAVTLADVLHDVAQVGGRQVERGAAQLEPLRVEQLADEVAQPPRLPNDARDPGGVSWSGRIAPDAPLEQLRLAEHHGQRRPQVVRGGGQELLLQPGRLLASAQLAGVGGQRSRLEQDAGVAGQQLEQPQVVLDEDRLAVGVDAEHADASIVGRDRRRDDRSSSGHLVGARMLRVGVGRVDHHQAPLRGVRPAGDEQVVRVLHPLPGAGEVSKDASVGVGYADRRASRAECSRSGGLELRQRKLLVRDAGDMDGLLQEVAQIRLAPGTADPRRRSEAQVEGDDGAQGEHLRDEGEGPGAVADEGADQDGHDGADEQGDPDCDRSHPPASDAAGPDALPREGDRGIPAHRHEEADGRQLDDLGHGRERGDRQRADRHERDRAGNLHPARRAAEVVDEPQHRERHGVEQRQRQPGDARIAIEPDPFGDAGEHEHARDCAEQQRGIDRRAAGIPQGVGDHDREEADEEDVVDEADEVESCHGHHARVASFPHAACQKSTRGRSPGYLARCMVWRKQLTRWSSTRPADCMKA